MFLIDFHHGAVRQVKMIMVNDCSSAGLNSLIAKVNQFSPVKGVSEEMDSPGDAGDSECDMP